MWAVGHVCLQTCSQAISCKVVVTLSADCNMCRVKLATELGNQFVGIALLHQLHFIALATERTIFVNAMQWNYSINPNYSVDDHICLVESFDLLSQLSPMVLTFCFIRSWGWKVVLTWRWKTVRQDLWWGQVSWLAAPSSISLHPSSFHPTNRLSYHLYMIIIIEYACKGSWSLNIQHRYYRDKNMKGTFNETFKTFLLEWDKT